MGPLIMVCLVSTILKQSILLYMRTGNYGRPPPVCTGNYGEVYRELR